ncbi:hypothetical protein BGZ79_007500 [Entomortierella chlamydospora]|nr:hypothetical protein BGZ79_007500 [Entomortierella chlamydospora]
MLAHNKIQVCAGQEYIHIAHSQSQSLRCDPRETFWSPPSDEKATQRVESREVHMDDQQSYRHDSNHRLQAEQQYAYQQQGQGQEQEYHHDYHDGHQAYRYHVEQRTEHSRSMSSIRSTTIHPTIANMVSPTSPRFAPSLSFRRFPSAPSPPSRSRNVSMSPKREQESLDRHRHYRRHSLSSSPSLSPQKFDDGEVMDMDQEYAFEELESDSMMDQCDPQRGWSSSSSQQTKSPSPVMSCTPYQLPSLKRHSSFSSSSSSSSRHSQQELPPPQQQPLRDQYTHPRSGYPAYDRDSSPRQLEYNHYHDYQQSYYQRQHGPADDALPLTESTASSESGYRQKSPSMRPRRLKVRPYSFPSSVDVGVKRYTSSGAVSPLMFAQSSNCRKSGDRLSPSIRPQTPPYLNLLPPQQPEGSHFEKGVESRKRERDTERDSDRHKRTVVLPLPKSYEFMSEAQRTLYERHPPSPQYDRSSTSSSAPPSPPRSSQSPSTPIPPIQPTRRASFERSHADIPRHTPPPLAPLERPRGQQLEPWRSYPAPQTLTKLPKLSTLALVRRQSCPEAENLSSSSPKSSMSSISSSSPSLLPSPPMTTPTASSASAGNSLPGTDGMTVVKTEEGAIMVYNPATDSMTFRCELCPTESFGRIHDLKRHQTSKHQEMTWPCEFCHRPFVRRDALLRHYTVKAARDDGLHPASHEVEKLLAARARAKMLY